ncbi:hypothetical protein ABPG72_020152 [Tetrahymena utriculariae]
MEDQNTQSQVPASALATSQTHFFEFIDLYHLVHQKNTCFSFSKLKNCQDNNCPSLTVQFLNQNTCFYLIRHALDLNILSNKQIQNVLSIQIQIESRIQRECLEQRLAQFKQFCKTFKTCPNLISFQLRCSFKQSEFLLEIPFIFHSHTSTHTLSKIALYFTVQDTFLSNVQTAQSFFNDLSLFKSLKILTLGLVGNKIDDTIMVFLSNCISSLPLQQLNLYLPYNQIDKLGVQLLCQSIANLRQHLLKLELLLEHNDFILDSNTCVTFITFISQCLLLRSIYLKLGSHRVNASYIEILNTGKQISSLLSKLVFLSCLTLISFRQILIREDILIRKISRLTSLFID